MDTIRFNSSAYFANSNYFGPIPMSWELLLYSHTRCIRLHIMTRVLDPPAPTTTTYQKTARPDVQYGSRVLYNITIILILCCRVL